MDDPGWSWPAWKFGLKRDDLSTTLHEQYNTVSFSIQDSEAFHHDVYEISHDAETPEEFHRLMADRRQQRLRELNESLESLAVEIIANPKLMKTDQWQHALQLFQSKSFDSIVRFFASYLPDDYLERRSTSSTSSSFSETDSVQTDSTAATGIDDLTYPIYLNKHYLPESPAMTAEPDCLHPDIHGVEAPLSPPESEQDHSSESVSSPTDTTDSHSYTSTRSPSRSMSFSGSESGFNASILRQVYARHDDETSQSDECDTAATSVSDSTEARSMLISVESERDHIVSCVVDDDEYPPAQYPEDGLDDLDKPTCNDLLDSDTPTPRQETPASNYIDYKSVLSRRLPSYRRSPSPKPIISCGETTPVRSIRRSPEEARNKIQKPISDTIRRRPKGRV